MGEYMGIQWSVYTTTTIIMMKSIFFAALVAAVAAEAAPEADADAYYGAYGYSGLTNYGLNRLSYGGAYGLGLRSYAAAPAYTGYSAYTGYGNLYGAGYGARYLGKRSADAEPEAEAEADAYYGNGYTLGYGYSGLNNYAAVRSYAAPAYSAYAAPAYSAYAAPAYTGYGNLYGAGCRARGRCLLRKPRIRILRSEQLRRRQVLRRCPRRRRCLLRRCPRCRQVLRRPRLHRRLRHRILRIRIQVRSVVISPQQHLPFSNQNLLEIPAKMSLKFSILFLLIFLCKPN